jgi:hypothetical protein
MTLANSVFVDQIVAHLPQDLQALFLNPPNLSSPSSFLPIIRTILPYTKYVVVLLAFYIVWSTIAGLFGYFSRFVRFALRIGPILGIIAWVMSNSGQGGMDELFDMVKQWTGLAPQNNRAGTSPGIASLAGLFGGTDNSRQRRWKTRGCEQWRFRLHLVSTQLGDRNWKGRGLAGDGPGLCPRCAGQGFWDGVVVWRSERGPRRDRCGDET